MSDPPLSVDILLKSLLAGGVSGMAAKTTVAPLDRIKILLQAQNQHYKHLGVWQGLVRIVKQETWWALYKGNGAQMLRIFPYASIQFGSYEAYKSFLPQLIAVEPDAHVVKLLAGSLGGLTAVTATFPLDTIRARLAFQVQGEHRYRGIVDAGASIVRDEGGVRGLYRGLSPTLVAIVPYAGLTFYCFEVLKFLMVTRLASPWTVSGDMSLTVPAKMLCGGVAGAVGQTAAYPLDVTRRRMQLAKMVPETSRFSSAGLVRTLVLVYREDGVARGLYRGMSVNYVRAVPMMAVTFSVYETVKQKLGLETGIKMSTG